jgi:hypothetical protein
MKTDFATVGRALSSPAREAQAFRFARTCYDHLAGTVGVMVFDALVFKAWLVIGTTGCEVTPAGERSLARGGIDVPALSRTRRCLARPCIDWSERRPHLAGALGAAVATRALQEGWAQRTPGARAVRITDNGVEAFRDLLGLRLDLARSA